MNFNFNFFFSFCVEVTEDKHDTRVQGLAG